MKYPVIADSGTNYHMFKEHDEFFIDLQPAKGSVLLGDGKTLINIQGIGTVQCYISNHLVTLHDVRYIPSLGESIYSLFLHIKSPNHGLESTSDQGLFLNFPTFSTRAIIGATDIYLDVSPVLDNLSLLPSSVPIDTTSETMFTPSVTSVSNTTK